MIEAPARLLLLLVVVVPPRAVGEGRQRGRAHAQPQELGPVMAGGGDGTHVCMYIPKSLQLLL